MAIAPAMKEITENIASSYEARAAEVGRLKKEAKEMLASFQASFKEMGTQLRRDLARGEAEREQAAAGQPRPATLRYEAVPRVASVPEARRS